MKRNSNISHQATKVIHLVSIFFVIVAISACSGTKWVIQPDPVIDYRSGDVIENYTYIRLIKEPTPRLPVLEFELRTVNVVEYPQRVESQRYVQRYKPRPGLLALSLAASAAVLYVANSPNINTEGGFKNQKLVLNSAAGVLALSGFLALKPDGNPVATEERRLLGQTGTVISRDTVSYVSDIATQATITIRYKGEVLASQLRKEFIRGRMIFDISREAAIVPVQATDPGVVELDIESLGAQSTIEVPITAFMAQYVEVSATSTPLRSGPREVPGNILADIVQGSQLQYQETYDETWIRVLYGVASTYVKRSDIELIWRTMGQSGENLVTTEREANYGNVDIEVNIPINPVIDQSAYGVIIGNADYLAGIPRRRTAALNLDIIERYSQQSIGISDHRLLTLSNPERFDFEELFSFGGRQTGLRTMIDNSTRLFIYISGRGYYDDSDSESLYLLPSDARPEDPSLAAVRLDDLFRAFSRLPFAQSIIVIDADFYNRIQGGVPQTGRLSSDLFERATSEFLSRPNTAVLFSNQPSQLSGDYISRDGRVNNKYSIASYFFVKALRENRMSVGDIYKFMDNNINFTSRLLHDRAQIPVLLGNPDLMLIQSQ